MRQFLVQRTIQKSGRRVQPASDTRTQQISISGLERVTQLVLVVLFSSLKPDTWPKWSKGGTDTAGQDKTGNPEYEALL